LTRIIVEAGCTISLGGGGRGGLRWPEVAGLHLQRLTERPSRVGAAEVTGVQPLSGRPARRKPGGEAVGWRAGEAARPELLWCR